MGAEGNGDFGWRYAEYFDTIRADNSELLDQAYRVRYQVYCLEHPFEKADEHSDGRERDPDDDRSVHALLVHRATGAFAGTVRVILPKNVESRPLPIQKILSLQDTGLLKRLTVRSTAEISRFAVSKEFRRRRGEERYPDVNVPGDASAKPEETQMIPYITFGLIRGVVEICQEHGISYIAAVMEPALIRILGRFGVYFEQIGQPVEYHGTRQACVACLSDLVERNRNDKTLLWQYTSQYAVGLSSPGAAELR